MKTILTGDRPTGKLHIGHYVGSLQNRVRLQDTHRQFVMIADVQALTDNADNPQKVRDNVFELALDYLAVGIDPLKSHIFIQSMITEISELALYFMNLVTLAQTMDNPTVKEEVRQKKMGESVPLGFVVYPISQAADILAFKATVAPVGADQMPMIEQANLVARKFNATYGPIFDPVEAVLGSVARLPGTDGNAKMGKSLNNAIFLADDHKTIHDKVMSMYTDPNHVHKDQPGRVEGNVVFNYLDVFDTNQGGLAELKRDYAKGGVGDVEIKERLVNVLERLIAPIRENRLILARDMDYVRDVIEFGNEEAKKVVSATLQEVRSAMKLDYFRKK